MKAIAFRNPHSAIRLPFARRSESGVALVVTLILLSIITFMAISFMVLSWSQFGAVNTEKDQTQARLAADAAAQRALAQMLAPMMANNNGLNYGLIVSTNFINPYGFITGSASPTNVNYDRLYLSAAPLSPADKLRNTANLWLDPRPPVFITNRFTGGLEFRFFLNLNRNSDANGNPLFDPTGLLTVTNPPPGSAPGTRGEPVVAPSGLWVSNFFVGDPQWIGMLQYPDRPHAPDNRFLSRYAYFVVPASKTLDLNYMYNYSKNLDRQMLYSTDSFLRNQGAGSGELNLAAFLVDLNTNFWPALRGAAPDTYPQSPGYVYPTGSNYCYRWRPQRDYTQPNSGEAFEDARALLRYRYLGQQQNVFVQNNLYSVATLYGAPGVSAFSTDFIDGYSAGPVMLASWPPIADTDAPRTALPWWGASNTNHFFTPQELFDKSKVAVGLPAGRNVPDRLVAAGSDTNSSYNRYTFYRLASQLGGESAVETGKMNLNYDNLCYRNSLGIASATNFVPWQPTDFFTNAANRLLANAGYNFTVTNIQIYPTNFYTPNVHRLLQLAANIYDATTNRLFGAATNLPSVFRPIFRRIGSGPAAGMVMIAGYREVLNDDVVSTVPRTAPSQVVLGYNQGTLPAYGQPPSQLDAQEPLVFGFPLVIGAKKGLPNFNEFAMQTLVQATRKVQFRRQGNNNNSAIVETNQMYMLSITNTCGIESWNSYVTTYPRALEMRIAVDTLAYMTNEFGNTLLTNMVANNPLPATIPANNWLGFTDTSGNGLDTSFRAWITNFLFLTNSIYSGSLHLFIPATDNFERGQGFFIPHWYLSLRPQVRFALVDVTAAPARIVDYVSLDNPQAPVDLTQLLTTGGQCTSPWVPDGSAGSMWCTNRDSPLSMTYGVANQINGALEQVTVTQWPGNHDSDVDFFRVQILGPNSELHHVQGTYSQTNTFVCPYSPSRQMSFYTSWQANDPLVHYMMSDLADPILGQTVTQEVDTLASSPMNGLGGNDVFTGRLVGNGPYLNRHYRPWGGNPNNTRETSPIASNWRLNLKDPLVTRSDYWNFPTNRFPNVGWLGRVHRGTPWQTVYLKSLAVESPNPGADITAWTAWTGDNQFVVNWNGQRTVTNDASFSLPTRDRYILDLFTTAFNDNAALGQMSVNQEGLAAWSALLSGVVVLTNAASDQAVRSAAQPPPPIAQACDPAGAYDPFNTNTWSQLVRIVNGINTVRAANSGGVFRRVGDILAVPELTVASPFLNYGVLRDPRTTPPMSVRGQYTYQYTSGLSDEAYERIPQQVLGLLRADATPRFVIYAFGQGLKPAEHSVVTGGGQYFQLCTNYQITAEVVTRTVVRIDGAPNNSHAVIENFNVLSSDY